MKQTLIAEMIALCQPKISDGRSVGNMSTNVYICKVSLSYAAY